MTIPFFISAIIGIVTFLFFLVLFAPITQAGDGKTFGGWKIPKHGKRFEHLFQEAEHYYDMPNNLLARIAQQESNFDPDAVGPNGEQGMMQINLRVHSSISRKSARIPYEAIDFAAKYLAYLSVRTGSWRDAIAAYNWGIGNIRRKGFDAAPESTKRYVREVMFDIGLED